MAKGPAGPTPDDIMKPAGMKAMLNTLTSQDSKPLNCAVAKTEDGDAVVVLERIGSPKAARKQLVEESKKVKLDLTMMTIRYGHVSIKPGDPETLLFTINRDPAGGAIFAKLVKDRCKLAGWSKIEFAVNGDRQPYGLFGQQGRRGGQYRQSACMPGDHYVEHLRIKPIRPGRNLGKLQTRRDIQIVRERS